MTDIVNSLTSLSKIRSGLSAAQAQATRTSRIMWVLGGFIFSRDTVAPAQTSRSTQYKWAAQQRVGRDDALQYLGPGKDTKIMNGDIFPEYKGGTEQISALRILAEQGEALMLVDGRGYVYGRWCITSINEVRELFFENGAPKKIEFNITLERYGEDEGSDVFAGVTL
ncbi:phage tail protein [Pseudomonas sp. HK3]